MFVTLNRRQTSENFVSLSRMDLIADDLDITRRGGGGLPAVPYMPAEEHTRTWTTFFVVCFFVSALVSSIVLAFVRCAGTLLTMIRQLAGAESGDGHQEY